MWVLMGWTKERKMKMKQDDEDDTAEEEKEGEEEEEDEKCIKKINKIMNRAWDEMAKKMLLLSPFASSQPRLGG